MAADHINARNFSIAKPSASSPLNSTTVSTFLVRQEGGMEQTFADMMFCISNKVHAIIGLSNSRSAQIMSNTIMKYRSQPAISFAATSAQLSGAPFFARTVPSDDSLANPFARFLRAAGWRRIAFLYSDEP